MINGISQNYRNYNVNNFQKKNNVSNVMFKATQKQLSAKINVAKPKIFTSIAAFVAGLFAFKKQNSTEGKQMVKNINEIMSYIESLPEYNSHNFVPVMSGCHSRELQFGPVRLNDGSEATVNYKLMEHTYDLNSTATKTLTVKNKNSNVCAVSKKEYAYTSKFEVRDKLCEDFNSGNAKWNYYYDRTNAQFYNKKGKPVEPAQIHKIIYKYY